MNKSETKLDPQNIPKHIAIIMDGNRRWAVARGKTVNEGHEEGTKNAVRIVQHAKDLGIKYLTLYTLSTENWRKRSKEEAKGLFNLLVKVAKEKKEEYEKQGIKISVLGDFRAFPKKVAKVIEDSLKIVLDYEQMTVNLALNYGGRSEIIRAVREIVRKGIPPSKIDEKLISEHLYTNGQPDPDLVIRTGGEVRVSNFLLWQASYSELYFTDTLWPDFGPVQLEKAILEYQKRQRRFGK